MSPVHTSCVFVHPIPCTHESKYMHGCRYALNGTETTLDGSQCLGFMYDQTLGWSYVNTPGIQRCGNHWQQASECLHAQERILIPCCICSWHARDLLTRQETNTRRILHMDKNSWNQSHRMCVTTGDYFINVSYFYCTPLIRVQHWECCTIVDIESFHSEHIYWRDFVELIYWCNGSIMNIELQRLCSRAHLLVRFHRLIQSEFRFLP
jgi:hypothetical protein